MVAKVPEQGLKAFRYPPTPHRFLPLRALLGSLSTSTLFPQGSHPFPKRFDELQIWRRRRRTRPHAAQANHLSRFHAAAP